MSTQGSPPILNPNIYLNYLGPDEASNYELSRNIALVTLGALIWDILFSIADDYGLIRMGRPSVTLFAYFLARPSVLVMVVLAILQKTGPLSNCTLVAMFVVAFQVITSAAASFLFLKRVHAVYHGSRTIQYVFNFLWVIGVGTSCAVFFSTMHDYSEIADTKHCIRHQGWTALSIAFMDPVLFDTLVYFAIVYKILSGHRMGQKNDWRTFCCGNGLPHLSRAVFQGGQQYYLITTGANLMRFVLSADPFSSPTLQTILSTPAVMLTSAMACRVYRNLLIKTSEECQVTCAKLTTPVFANGQMTDAITAGESSSIGEV
ncbi:hypothetical protein F5J12DRAFT_816291 [Pisolithus orientalis]|uniref:uncharacterized protein n=1 Tax=Pisolithus orientalis TaxID=936130 RepID=UPI0022254553|nr:uncharacterized protein F5J12DRAFT_816291 [Pisolithus orientalis]KAI6015149.1 hypothetical protein F5J12DRAFT_816291 [Pisolithus orientalis]